MYPAYRTVTSGPLDQPGQHPVSSPFRSRGVTAPLLKIVVSGHNVGDV